MIATTTIIIRERGLFLMIFLFILQVLWPAAVFAQFDTIETVAIRLLGLVNSLIPILMILGTAVFLWGLVKYITAAGDEAQTADGRRLMMWGLIALAIMVAVWGFVNLLLQFIFPVSGGKLFTPIGPVQF